LQKTTLDGPDRGRGNIAVFERHLIGVCTDERHQRLQIFQIKQQQAVVIGVLKCDRKNAFLRLVQLQQTGEQDRPHFRDSGPQRVALFAENVPDRGGKAFEIRGYPKLLVAGIDLGIAAARLSHACQVSFYIGHKDRYAEPAKAFGQPLERDGLAGTGRTGDHAVPVRHLRQQIKLCLFVFSYEDRFCHMFDLFSRELR